jgi:hypothetical protein
MSIGMHAHMSTPMPTCTHTTFLGAFAKLPKATI